MLSIIFINIENKCIVKNIFYVLFLILLIYEKNILMFIKSCIFLGYKYKI